MPPLYTPINTSSPRLSSEKNAPPPAMALLKLFCFFAVIVAGISNSAAAGPLLPIGVNYGTLADNLPPPAQVAAFLKQHTTINSVKFFNTDPSFIKAFAGTGITVTVNIGNGEIPSLAKFVNAQKWVSDNIAPYVPATLIKRIVVGNEIMATADKNLIAHLLPAMKSIYAALRAAKIDGVQVTTPHSLGILSRSQPPSSGRFRRGYDKIIFAPMLQFLNSTKSAFMVNPYPYFGYSEKTVDYALFKPNGGIYDPVTKVNYTNMFDGQMDAVYSAMKALGYGDVEIVVGETGWPSAGDPNQLAVNIESAMTYNRHVIDHVSSGKGTPLMPNRKFETYIFSLFNENQKPGPTAERNFGLFWPDLSPVYDAGIMKDQVHPVTPAPVGSGKLWCMPKVGASDQALQANIDYVCSSGVDCQNIQANGLCFLPNTIRSHAAYAMNSYYRSEGANTYNCDFAQTGVLVDSDPSFGDCKYQ